MKTTDSKFEYNVLRIACFFGLVRSIIEVSRDLLSSVIEPNFFLDIAFIFVFASTLIALNFHFPFKRILYLFYFPFIVLITIMFIDGVGISYSVENNVFAGIIIIALTIRGRMVIYFIGAFLLCIFIGIAIVEYQYQLTSNFQSLSDNPFSFIFASLGSIAFTLYAKMEFWNRRKNLFKGIESLNERHEELRRKNEELLTQKESLESLINKLDSQVNNRSTKIKNKKKQVEEYLSVTLNELFDAYESVVASINDLEDDDEPIVGMIKDSTENLKHEMNGLRAKIEESVATLD